MTSGTDDYTLLSVVGKLFTSIIDNRLNEWAENYHVYIEAQAEWYHR